MKEKPSYALKRGDILETGRVIRQNQGFDKDDQSRGQYKIVAIISDDQSTGFSYEAVGVGSTRSNEHFFIKTPRLKQGVSDFETKNYLLEVYRQFSSDYQNRDRFEKNENVAKVKGFGTYEFEDKRNKQNLIIPFLVQEFVKGETLVEFLEHNYHRDKQRPAIKSAEDFFKIAKSIVKAVRRIHNQQVIHGDIRPKNIMVQNESGEGIVRLLGFTRSFMLDQAFHMSGGSLPQHAYRAPECNSPNGYWYTPADIYSLGGILFYLVTGEEPPAANSDEKKLKEEIVRRIKSANESIFKQNEGIVKIIDKCLRFDPEERYPHVESIYSALQTFDYSYHSHVNIETLNVLVRELKTKTTKIIKAKNTFFANIFHQKMSMLKEDLEAIENDHFEIYGDREDIIDSLVRYLSVLEPGDQYLTVTKPAFWAPQNLGINGRFLTMNKVMATRGVIVRRVFLLTEEEALPQRDPKHDPETYEILKAHQEAITDMETLHGMDVKTFSIPKIPYPPNEVLKNSFYTGYRVLPKEEILQYEKQASHVALWRKTDGAQMSIFFISRPIIKASANKSGSNPIASSGERIVKVRFWKSKKQEKLHTEIEEQLSKSTPLKNLWNNKK